MSRARTAAILAAAAGLALASSTFGQVDTYWRNPTSGLWSLPANWTSGVPVTSGYIAHIDRPGSYTVTMDVAATVAGIFKPLANPEFDIPNYGALFITGGVFQNNGLTLVNAEAGGNFTYVQFNANAQLLADAGQSGELRLNANPANRDTAYLRTLGAAVLTNTPFHSITGAGRIYATLVNNGQVIADVPGSAMELLEGDKTNNSVMAASGGGRLQFTGVDMDQSPSGVVRALGGGEIFFKNTVIRGGTLDASQGGTLQIDFDDIITLRNGVVTAGPFNIPSEAVLFVDQAVWSHSQGPITVNSSGGGLNTYLRFERSCTTQGAQIVLRASPANLDSAFVSTLLTSVLTLDSASSIIGNGRVPATVVNNGTIGSGVGETLELLTGTKVNQGTFQTTGGTLVVRALDVTQSAAGRIRAVGGEVQLFDSVVHNGRLEASGGGIIKVSSGTDLVLRDGVSGSGPLQVPSGSLLSIDQTAWTHAGPVTMNTTGANALTTLNFVQSCTLAQAGILLNANQANRDTSGVTTTGVAVLTIDGTSAVSGQGRLYANLVNNGDITSGPGQTIELLGGSKTNNDTIKTTGGTVLVTNLDVTQGASGAFTADGGSLQFVGSTVRGGRIDALNGGSIQISPGTGLILRDGVGSSGPMPIPNNSTLLVKQPSWAHAGLITVNTVAGTNITYARFDQACTLSQANIVLNANTSNRDTASLQTLGGAVLTLNATTAVSGQGRLYANLINNAQISCSAGQTLELLGGTKTNNNLLKTTGGSILVTSQDIAQNATGRIVADGGQLRFSNATVRTGHVDATNGGTIELIPGSFLTLRDGVASIGPLNIPNASTLFINQPAWSHSGTVTVNTTAGATLTAIRFDQSCTVGNAELRLNAAAANLDTAYLYTLGGAIITVGSDATVSGRGNLYSAIGCAGTLSPGAGVGGIGQLNIQSSITMQNSAVAAFDISGVAASQFDRITGDTLTVNGTLRVRLAGGFSPQGGASFDVVNVTNCTGTFDELDLPRFSGGPPRFVVSYPTGKVRLTARACGPDFDADGFVSGNDFDLYVQGYENGDVASDYDGDGFVTGLDFDEFVQAFEQGC